MGSRERYDAGAFCWVEVVTPDLDRAQRFYRDLFGWVMSDRDGEPVFRLNGAVIAGARALSPELHAAGVPAHWATAISVVDLDGALARVAEHGGTTSAGPVESGGTRRVEIRDPAGAVVGLWEPHERHGVERVNDTGCWVWSELHTPDPEGARTFYGNAFGWEIRPQRQAPDYLIAWNNAWLNAGILPLAPEHDAPPHWLSYVSVTSCDEAAQRAGALGGEILGAPRDVSIGRIAVVRDPTGAVFAMFEGETDD